MRRSGLAITVSLGLAAAGPALAKSPPSGGPRPAPAKSASGLQRTAYQPPAEFGAAAPPAATPPPAGAAGAASVYPNLSSPYGGGAANNPGAYGTSYDPAGGVMTAPISGADMLAPHGGGYSGSYADHGPLDGLDDYPVLGTRVYGGLEYLLWYPRRDDLQNIAVQYPVSAITTMTNTSALFGTTVSVNPSLITPLLVGTDKGTTANGLSGFRATLGGFIDAAGDYGIEGVFIYLPEDGRNTTFASNGGPNTPILSRTFSDATAATGGAGGMGGTTISQVLLRVASPNDLAGSINFDTNTKFESYEANVRIRGPQVLSERFDWLVGFRYLNIDESVRIRDQSTVLSANGASLLGVSVPGTGGALVPIGSTLSTFDSFAARNQFYGANFGGHARYTLCNHKLVFDLIGKIAFGGTAQQVRIGGSTTLATPANPAANTVAGVPTGPTSQTVPFGILAGPNNSGKFYDARFVFVPELTINAGYHVTDNMLVFVGYNALYTDAVQRPASSIDTTVNPSQLPFRGASFPPTTVPRPAFGFSYDEFWLQGLNVGVQLTY
jgi:hypothetical protein